MPLFMDLHRFGTSISKEEAEMAHIKDLEVQKKYGVKYLRYWVNEEEGTVFCLIDAPSKEACHAVHDEAHGNLATEIIEVDYDDYSLYMSEEKSGSMGEALLSNGQLDSAVRTFLFTDIVDSTAMTQDLGDAGSYLILKRHNEIVRNALQEQGGTEVKHTGDGIMACFLSASRAVCCAIDIQVSIKKFREKYSNIPLHLRIGLNAGEPVSENDDFFGVAVQTASRICNHADPDKIFISNVVHDLCLGKSFSFSELGTAELKGIAIPQTLYEVQWEESYF
ncbi:MAG: DUF4242 domain-containing protein [Cyclobacteriaceae bacterium]|nr:DUF4242 domain-containing protein [Cyclobacteriaceae bacterium]